MEMNDFGNENGQSSVYDAMMFLSIMLVASALIIGASSNLLRAEDVQNFKELESHSIRYANAVLSSTVPNASYADKSGSNITSTDISVQDMVIEELVLLRSGVPEDNFNGTNGYRERTEHVLSSLLDKDRFQARLCGQYGEQEIAFGDDLPQSVQDEIAAYTTRISLPDAGNDVVIIVYLWWK